MKRRQNRGNTNPTHDHHTAIRKPPAQKKLSALQQRMRKKLDSAKFRMLNESLYSTTGAKAKTLMDENPELFQIYHTGYAEQVKRWPRNPLDDIVRFLSTQKKTLRIADLGCGEARLSREVPHHVKSFDLIAANNDVTPCDLAHVPLPHSSIDVAVFCLSLMGTNYAQFLHEAYRIVVPTGFVIVVEVASRFPNHDPEAFVQGIESIGFRINQGHPLMTCGRGRIRTKSSKRGKQRKRGKKVGAEGIESVDSAAFFHTFVFTSTKKRDEERKPPALPKNLPALAACMYKKR